MHIDNLHCDFYIDRQLFDRDIYIRQSMVCYIIYR
jgi:hypothetical protein